MYSNIFWQVKELQREISVLQLNQNFLTEEKDTWKNKADTLSSQVVLLKSQIDQGKITLLKTKVLHDLYKYNCVCHDTGEPLTKVIL